MKIYHVGVNLNGTKHGYIGGATARLAVCKKPPVAHMLSVYSSCQCTHKMQSLTMTQKDLAIDRRQIPTQEKGSAQRLGDRKGSGETNTGITPHPVSWLQSNRLFYLFIS